MASRSFGRYYYDCFNEPEYSELKSSNRRFFYHYIYQNDSSSNSGIYLTDAKKIHNFTLISVDEVRVYLNFPGLIENSFTYESPSGLIFFKKHLKNSIRIPGSPIKFVQSLINEKSKYRSSNLWKEFFEVNEEVLREFGDKYFLEKKEDSKKDKIKKQKGRDLLESFLSSFAKVVSSNDADKKLTY